MYRAIPSVNKICSKKMNDRDRELHKKHLQQIKSHVDNG